MLTKEGVLEDGNKLSKTENCALLEEWDPVDIWCSTSMGVGISDSYRTCFCILETLPCP